MRNDPAPYQRGRLAETIPSICMLQEENLVLQHGKLKLTLTTP